MSGQLVLILFQKYIKNIYHNIYHTEIFEHETDYVPVCSRQGACLKHGGTALASGLRKLGKKI